jgi:hypothetical protein
MKRFLAATILLAVATLFSGCAGMNSTMDYKVFAASPAKLDTKGSIEISGIGFHAGDNIVLLFNSADGIKSDLSGSLKPSPVADAAGNWKTTWGYGRMVKKKIISAGSYKIDVVNNDYEKLASVSVTFVK